MLPGVASLTMFKRSPAEAGPSIESDEDEEDFMSDRFLEQAEAVSRQTASTSLTSSARPETYSERRRKQLNAAQDQGRIASRAEREREARQKGLAQSLLDKQADQGMGKRKDREDDDGARGRQPAQDGGSKALRMMLAMGFKPGEALGKRTESQSGEEQGEGKAASSGVASAALPLPIDERWLGPGIRAGIGRLPRTSAVALSRDISDAAEQQAAREGRVAHDAVEDFRARARHGHESRHVDGLLAAARKTCEELDRSALEMTYSPLWIDPAALTKHTVDLPAHTTELIEFAFHGLDEIRTMDEDTHHDGKHREGSDNKRDEPQKEQVDVVGLGRLTKTGEQEESIGADHQAAIARAEEARRFCMLQSKDRLQITLSHLRRAHRYCLFCGHQYATVEELETQCPGEEEDDH